jgi:two-component system cell cycle response regulator
MTKVLVVDDSRTVRLMLRRDLEAAGIEVADAEDGLTAVGCFAEVDPDLVLLDIDMPGLDGYQTLQTLRQHGLDPAVPVMFLTARAGTDDVVAGLTLGAQDYLRKPCAPEELVARVTAALAVRSREASLRRRLDELSELTLTDALTGLGNRRQLDGMMRRLVRDEPDSPVAVLVADIDRFKDVNDTHGHLVGDIVLRAVADRIRTSMPENAGVGRWGGEEFLVILPGVDADQARAIAETARHAVRDEPVATGVGRGIEVSVSIGLAAGESGAVRELLALADVAVYAPTRLGRDRVVDRTVLPR